MILSDILSVLSPAYCRGCGKLLVTGEQFLCVNCREKLEETNFHLQAENLFTQRLTEECEVFAATALFYFKKDNMAQHLIHSLKYKGDEQIGEWLGQWLGEKIKNAPLFQQADVVLPVPLHKSKERKRGYNQVALFGRTLASVLHLDYIDDVLVKIEANTTQTRKVVWRRLKESEHIFSLQNTHRIEGKKVLLVDDVVTTGATLTNCYELLKTVPNVEIGVATMGYAMLG